MKASICAGLTFLTTFALVGCGTMNRSSSELVTNASAKQSVCIPTQRDIVEQRVATYLNACYGGKGSYMLPVSGVLMPMTGFAVQKELVKGATRFSVRTDIFYSVTVDVATQPLTCGTSLNVYAVNGNWNKTVNGLVAAARGESPNKCP